MTAQHDPRVAQREAALARANEVRMEIARRRRELAALDELASRKLAVERIEAPDDVTRATRIYHLLMSVRGFGRMRADRVLRLIDVREHEKRFGELTLRQRRVVADAVRDPSRFIPMTGMRRLEEDRAA